MIVSRRCLHHHSSSLASGASTRCSSLSNIQQERCRTPSTSPVRCILSLYIHNTEFISSMANYRSRRIIAPTQGLLRARLKGPRARRLRLHRLPRALVTRGVSQAPPAHPHHRVLRVYAVQARGALSWGGGRLRGDHQARGCARVVDCPWSGQGGPRWLPPREAILD